MNFNMEDRRQRLNDALERGRKHSAEEHGDNAIHSDCEECLRMAVESFALVRTTAAKVAARYRAGDPTVPERVGLLAIAAAEWERRNGRRNNDNDGPVWG